MSSPERASIWQRRSKGLFNDYGFLVGSALLLSFAMSSWGVLLPIYFRTVGLSVQQIGGLLSGLGLVGLFAALPLGFVTDQAGRKRGLVVSLVLYILLQLALGIAPNIWGIVFAVILSVFANQLHEVAENALVADFTSRHSRGQGYIQLDVGAGMVAIVGPFVGGMIVENFSYTALFFLAAFVTCIALVAALLIRERRLPASRASTNQKDQKLPLRQALARSWQAKHMRIFVIGLILATTSASLSNYIFPLYAEESLKISISEIGLIFSLASIPAAIVVLLGAQLIDRFGRTTSLGWAWLSGGGILIFGLLTISLSSHFVVSSSSYRVLLFALVLVAFSLVMSISTPTTKAIVMDLTPSEHRGAFHGALMMVAGLSTIPAPLLGGIIYGFSRIGPFVLSSLLYMCAGALLLSAQVRKE